MVVCKLSFFLFFFFGGGGGGVCGGLQESKINLLVLRRFVYSRLLYGGHM